MGMAFGLEDGKCSNEDLQKALKLVPKSLEPYVLGEMTRLMMTSLLCFCGMFCISFADMAKVKRGDNSGLSRSVLSPDTVPSPRISDPHLLPPSTFSDNSMDSEVAGLTLPIKREPTEQLVTSFASAHSPEDEEYSDGSLSDRSSPIDI